MLCHNLKPLYSTCLCLLGHVMLILMTTTHKIYYAFSYHFCTLWWNNKRAFMCRKPIITIQLCHHGGDLTLIGTVNLKMND